MRHGSRRCWGFASESFAECCIDVPLLRTWAAIIDKLQNYNTQNGRHGNQPKVTKGDERMKDW